MKEKVQYTIRHVPARVDERIRETATRYGTNLNETVLAVLSDGLGVGNEQVVHHDLDELIGSWVQDDACDRALEAMDRVDAELWK